MFALIEWKGEGLVNVYSFSRILSPQKKIAQIQGGGYCKGKIWDESLRANHITNIRYVELC